VETHSILKFRFYHGNKKKTRLVTITLGFDKKLVRMLAPRLSGLALVESSFISVVSLKFEDLEFQATSISNYY
jgi:hypothetical protein